MARLPDPIMRLSNEVTKIQENIKKLQNRSPFFGTGFHPTADNGIESDNFDGDLNAGNAGTKGWAMDSDQAAFGELILRPGSIGNDALTSPVIPQAVWHGTTANFGLIVPWTDLTSQTLTAPADATSVIVHGFVRLVAQNTTGSLDYLYSNFDIDGLSCGGFSTPVPAGEVGTSVCSFARVQTGVSSTTLTARGATAFASWASTNNVCQISASVLWFR